MVGVTIFFQFKKLAQSSNFLLLLRHATTPSSIVPSDPVTIPALPAMFPWRPDSEVSPDGGSKAAGTQEIDPRDPSGPKIGSGGSLGLQLARI